jgi:hypothetical protein
VQAALETVQESALKLPVFAGVAADITKQVASIVWAATYEVCIDHATSLEQIAIESSLVIEDPMGDDEQDNDKKCPDEMPICEDNECLGIDGVCKSVCTTWDLMLANSIKLNACRVRTNRACVRRRL